MRTYPDNHRPESALLGRLPGADGSSNRVRTTRFGEFTAVCVEHGPSGIDAVLRPLLHTYRTSLLVVIAGQVRIKHPDLSTVLGRRDSAILLGSAHLEFSTTTGARLVLCSVPESVVGMTLIPPSMPFVVARADTAVPSAIGALLFDLFQQDVHHSITVRQEVGELLESLVPDAATVIALGARKGWDRRRQRRAALRYVAAHYTDPDLDPDAVAKHLGISLRALQRVFEGDHGLTHYIRAVRAKAAATRLRDANLAAASMDDIATLSGFASVAAMCRAIQEVTGQPPEGLRAEAVPE